MNYRHRRVIAARHRQRDWDAEVSALHNADSLFYALDLIDELYGDDTPHLIPLDPLVELPTRAQKRRAAYDDFQHEQEQRLAILSEARPEEAAAIAATWAAWWENFRKD